MYAALDLPATGEGIALSEYPATPKRIRQVWRACRVTHLPSGRWPTKTAGSVLREVPRRGVRHDIRNRAERGANGELQQAHQIKRRVCAAGPVR